MNLSPFLAVFSATYDRGNASVIPPLPVFVDENFRECMDYFGGKTFNNGLYRVYRWDEILPATDQVIRLFSTVKGKILIFASDWSGRQFALDSKESKDGVATISCYEMDVPSTFCTDMNITDFHNIALVDYQDAALAYPFYQSWHKVNPAPIAPDQCVGCKVPLFLGGQEVLENLSLTDMSVYLKLCGDLYAAVKDLPAGMPIDNILLKLKEHPA